MGRNHVMWPNDHTGADSAVINRVGLLGPRLTWPAQCAAHRSQLNFHQECSVLRVVIGRLHYFKLHPRHDHRLANLRTPLTRQMVKFTSTGGQVHFNAHA